MPRKTERFHITLTLASPAPNDTVVKAEIFLVGDVDLAHTESEYDATMLYAAVSPLLGNGCPGLQKLALYRFFENTLKPREVKKTEILQNGIFHRTRETVDTDKIVFCGALFRIAAVSTWNGTPEFPSGRPPPAQARIDLE